VIFISKPYGIGVIAKGLSRRDYVGLKATLSTGAEPPWIATALAGLAMTGFEGAGRSFGRAAQVIAARGPCLQSMPWRIAGL